MSALVLLDLVARSTVATVFVVAAILKLRDLSAFRAVLVRYRGTRPLADVLMVAVPAVEIACAAAILSAHVAFVGALASAALLVGFTGFLLVTDAGADPNGCGCLGRRGEPRHVSMIRNGLLLALVAVALARAPEAPRAGYVGAEAALALLILPVLAGLWLDNRQLRRIGRAGGPVAAERRVAPEFALPSPDGTVTSLAGVRARGRPVLLVFVDAFCTPCERLLPAVARWQSDLSGVYSIIVVAAGGELAAKQAFDLGLRDVALQRGREIAGAYGVLSTPSARLVDLGGFLEGEVAVGATEIAGLVHVNGPSAVQAAKAPSLMVFLRRDDELSRELLAHLGRLAASEGDRRAPRLVIVSPDVTDADTDLPIISDPGSAIALGFGAAITPAAVLVDEVGARASQVVSGPLRVRSFSAELLPTAMHA
jgi:thiol-disulfide isomerase/thioredoxin